jgi:hypothetical protein
VPTQHPQERREPVMTQQLETTRIFLDDHRRGVVTCPYCGDTHVLNMTRYPAPSAGKPATCSAGPVAACFASSLMAVVISGSR